ncbi:hypothetical protein JCM33374_g4189 [Metschnikowia sp. JCM 33374]|nr:hypothetical protein JCM33374_g4189 [Metschnikowia sp. JCM 33374]
MFAAKFRFAAKPHVTPAEATTDSEALNTSTDSALNTPTDSTLNKVHGRFHWRRKTVSSFFPTTKQTEKLSIPKTTSGLKTLSAASLIPRLVSLIRKPSQVFEKESGTKKKFPPQQSLDCGRYTTTMALKNVYSVSELITTGGAAHLDFTSKYDSEDAAIDVSSLMEFLQAEDPSYTTNKAASFYDMTHSPDIEQDTSLFHYEQENSLFWKPILHLQLPSSADSVFKNSYSFSGVNTKQSFSSKLSSISLASYESFNWNIDFREVNNVYSEVGNSPECVTHSESKVTGLLPGSSHLPETAGDDYCYNKPQTFLGAGNASAVKNKPATESKAMTPTRKAKEGLGYFMQTFRTSMFATSSWYVKNKSEDTLWYVLALENVTSCRRFKSEYSKNEGFSLFLDTMKKLRCFSPLSTLTSNFADNHLTTSKSFRETLSNLESFVNGSSVSTQVSNATFSRKTSKKLFSMTDREKIERAVKTLASMCEEKVEELKIDPEMVNCGETLELFSQYFDVYRKDYVRVAKNQIIDYVYVMLELRKETIAVFKNLYYAGNMYARVLEYLSISKSSTETLLAAETMLTVLITQLTNAKSSLDKVQLAILQLKEEVDSDLVPIISLAHRVISIRAECSGVHRKFCQTNMAKSLGMAMVNRSTNFVKLLDESDFLVSRLEAIQTALFQDALDDLKHWQEIVGDVQIELEIDIWRIFIGITEIRSPVHQQRPISFTGPFDLDQQSVELFDSSSLILRDEESTYSVISADSFDMVMIQELEASSS